MLKVVECLVWAKAARKENELNQPVSQLCAVAITEKLGCQWMFLELMT